MSRTFEGFGGLVLAGSLIFLVLVLPSHPDFLVPSTLLQLPLELVFVAALLVALSLFQPWSRLVRLILVLALTLLCLLKLADLASFTAFNRPFNPLMDLHLAEAAFRLAGGSVGWPLATVLALGVVLLPFLLAGLLWWATGRLSQWRVTAGQRTAAVLVGSVALGLIIVDLGTAGKALALPFDVPGDAFSTRLAIDRTAGVSALYADLAAFEQEAATDPFSGANGLFDRLEGRDVLVVFVESYGQTSYVNPLYAPTHLPTLEQAEKKLAAAGLSMRSAWLTSPVAGGQSWLAHATIASGLTIDNQARYRAMLASTRPSLYHLAQEAGYQTATMMPAITLPWPEAQFMGFSRIYEAADLGYRGEAFNWTTMPDQYTLSAIERLMPADAEQRFAMTALLSSHAPWTPVPKKVDWAAVGDGAVFDASQHVGPPGGDVWANRDLMREQYRLAVDYSLEIVFDLAVRNVERDWLLVVLGDHPPAQSVSLIDGQDVPVHIIGSDAALAAFDDWDFKEGLIPSADSPVWPMAAFRDRFIAALSTSVPAEAGR